MPGILYEAHGTGFIRLDGADDAHQGATATPRMIGAVHNKRTMWDTGP